MKLRSGLTAAIAVATMLLTFGLLAAPAGALSTSATAVTGNAATISTGGTLVFTATVSGPGGTPVGTVVWTGSACSSTTALTAGVATCLISNAQASTAYNVTATFTDTDGNYSGSSGSSGSVSPGVATSATAITNNAASTSTGGILVFFATVSGPGGTPVGTVAWTGSACSSTTALTAGVATCLISNAQASTAYNVTATFTDTDGNYSGSSGSSGSVSPGVASQATLIVTSTTGTFGTPLTLTASGGSSSGAVSYAVANGTASNCAVSAGQLTSTSAGTCLVTATRAADANYSQVSSAQTTVTLAPANQATLTVTSTTGTFGTPLILTASGGSGTGAVTYAVVGDTASGCAISSGQLTSTSAGTCLVTATKAADANYIAASSAQTTVTVGQATPTAPTITNPPTSGIFGGGFTAVVNTNGDGTRSVTSSTPTVCSTSGLAVTYVGVGMCSLNAQVSAGINYLARSGAAQTFTIGRANATIPTITNIPSPASEFFGFTADLGTTGDGTPSVTSSTPGVCSVGTNGITVTFVGFGTCTLTPSVAQGVNYFGATGSPESFPVKEASHGYWLVGSDGGIFSFGTAAFHGSMGGTALQRPVVGITPTSTGNGYWLVASDGGIFSFGDASYYGSIPGVGLHPAGSGQPNSLNAPIVGMVPTFTGRGYFMVASDGGVFAFGDAKFEGSCPGIGGCVGAAVAVMPDRSGNGYWLVTGAGGVYAFGDATFYGAPPSSTVPVVGAVATPDGNGYWLLYANGVVDNFGDASPFGAPLGYVNVFNPATTIFRTQDGQGYWVASARGDVFSYGDSPFLGSMAGAGLNGEIIGAFGF